MSQFWRYLTRCLSIAITPHRQISSQFWTWNFFMTKLKTFAVECNWNKNISWNVQNLGLFLKKMFGFSKKDLICFQNLQSWQICYRLIIKWFYFLKRSFPPHLWDFSAKSQIILNVGNFINYHAKRAFFREKKRFHLFKSLPYRNGKARKMPLVAGPLVAISGQKGVRCKDPNAKKVCSISFFYWPKSIETLTIKGTVGFDWKSFELGRKKNVSSL